MVQETSSGKAGQDPVLGNSEGDSGNKGFGSGGRRGGW